jgi:pilus assembly protein CpaF
VRRGDEPMTSRAENSPTPTSGHSSQARISELALKIRQRLIEADLDPDPGAVTDALHACGVVAGPSTTAALVEQLTNEMTGAGALHPLLAQPGVTDVLVNGPTAVWVDDGAGLHLTDLDLGDETYVRQLAQRLASQAGRRLDDASPFVDARLPNGVRLHAALGTVAAPGTLISLRVPASATMALGDFCTLGALPVGGDRLLRALIDSRVSFLVTGGTGSGKTTLLRAMLADVESRSRILVVEESAELNVPHPHAVSLEGRPANAEGAGRISLSDLVRQAMRMRPDRIVVGEVRGSEVKDLLSAMNTGHEGCAGTIHANSAEMLPERIEALGLAAGMPRLAVHAQMAAGVQAVLHVERGSGGVRRVAGVWALDRGSDGFVRLCRVWDLSRSRTVLLRPGHWLAERLRKVDRSERSGRIDG